MNDLHFRKLAAGLALVATPLLATASWILWPVASDTASAIVADVLDYSRARVLTAIVLGVAAIAIGIVAVIALVHMLHERKRVVGLIGGGVGIIGLSLFAVQAGMGIASFEISRGAFPTGNKEFLVQMLLDSDLAVLGYVGGAMMALGFVLVAVNLFAARTVPVPSSVLFAAFAVTQLVGYVVSERWTLLASYICLCAALIPVGVEVLVESDESWEHPPTYEGLRMIGAHA
jgi:hypothetical protein